MGSELAKLRLYALVLVNLLYHSKDLRYMRVPMFSDERDMIDCGDKMCSHPVLACPPGGGEQHGNQCPHSTLMLWSIRGGGSVLVRARAPHLGYGHGSLKSNRTKELSIGSVAAVTMPSVLAK